MASEFAVDLISSVGVLNEDTADVLISAFSKVSRQTFIPDHLKGKISETVVCPLENGRFILKPTDIARMLALIGLHKRMRVLEIGCGCGYTSALMATVGVQVFALEKDCAMAQHTRKLLDSLGYQGIVLSMLDGDSGWEEFAPYDAIIYSVPVCKVEQKVLQQLIQPNGILVAAVGDLAQQQFMLYENKESGIAEYALEYCSLYK